MKAVHTEADFYEHVRDPKLTVALFKAEWCSDCRFIDPFMPEVEKAYEGRLRFIVVDRDELGDLCFEYNIMGIPSFVVFKEGKEVTRFVSKLRKTRAEIEQFLDRSLEVAEAMGQ